MKKTWALKPLVSFDRNKGTSRGKIAGLLQALVHVVGLVEKHETTRTDM